MNKAIAVIIAVIVAACFSGQASAFSGGKAKGVRAPAATVKVGCYHRCGKVRKSYYKAYTVYKPVYKVKKVYKPVYKVYKTYKPVTVYKKRRVHVYPVVHTYHVSPCHKRVYYHAGCCHGGGGGLFSIFF